MHAIVPRWREVKSGTGARTTSAWQGGGRTEVWETLQGFARGCRVACKCLQAPAISFSDLQHAHAHLQVGHTLRGVARSSL
eukprot:1945875-Alexandrium_andersonii.AAC.1